MEQKINPNIPMAFHGLARIPNTELGNLQEIASGSFGTVYHGNWSNQEVAVKKLHGHVLPSDIEYFQREAVFMAKLQSPYVIGLHGICIEGNRFSIVMPYMSKGTLEGVLQNPQEYLPWNEPRRIDIAINTGKGLAYLHERDIIHRDIKSLNILLDADYNPKITDFGFAKVKINMTKRTGVGSALWIARNNNKLRNH